MLILTSYKILYFCENSKQLLMEYIELTAYIENQEEKREILTAILGDSGFESFIEDEKSLKAYIPANQFNEDEINDLFTNLYFHSKIEFSFQTIADQNWNAVWESNYAPVIIDDQVSIRAPFHQRPDNIDYHIIIEPKMSFGTAHHPTTAQIISLMLDINFKDKTVMDMGCGTSVLAILASMLGASEVDAVDNDEWAYNNSIENIDRNKLKNIHVFMDDAGFVTEDKADKYDIFIANINRNILLNDLEHYAFATKSSGFLLMSGFYDQDLEMLNQKANDFDFKFLNKKVSDYWCAAVWQLIDK